MADKTCPRALDPGARHHVGRRTEGWSPTAPFGRATPADRSGQTATRSVIGSNVMLNFM